jgi:hypothetical protein
MLQSASRTHVTATQSSSSPRSLLNATLHVSLKVDSTFPSNVSVAVELSARQNRTRVEMERSASGVLYSFPPSASVSLSPRVRDYDVDFVFGNVTCPATYKLPLYPVECAPGYTLRGDVCEQDSASICLKSLKASIVIDDVRINSSVLVRADTSSRMRVELLDSMVGLNVSFTSKLCSASKQVLFDGTVDVPLQSPGAQSLTLSDGRSSCTLLDSVQVDCPKGQRLVGPSCMIACNETREVLTAQCGLRQRCFSIHCAHGAFA